MTRSTASTARAEPRVAAAATSSPAPRSVRCSATVLARAYDEWWRALGEPDPFIVVDCGAGTGTLANSVRLAEPACLARPHLRVGRALAGVARPSWRSPVPGGSRARARSAPSIRRVRQLGTAETRRRANAVRARGSFPSTRCRRCRSSGSSPRTSCSTTCPSAWCSGPAAEWLEVRVALDAEQQLVEQLVPATERLALAAEALMPAAVDGARFPIADASDHMAAQCTGTGRSRPGRRDRLRVDHACAGVAAGRRVAAYLP